MVFHPLKLTDIEKTGSNQELGSWSTWYASWEMLRNFSPPLPKRAAGSLQKTESVFVMERQVT